MTTRVGIRDLRNRTAEIIELARVEGEVVITSHNAPVAVLRPVVDRWDQEIDRIIAGLPEPMDSGLTELLAHDDAQAIDLETAAE